MSKQPRDDGNDPIPVLGLRPGRGLQVPYTSNSNTSPAISSSVRVITVYATTDCFIETGNASISADTVNSHFLPAQIPYDLSLGAENNAADNDKYVAVIQSASGGTLYISERE